MIWIGQLFLGQFFADLKGFAKMIECRCCSSEDFLNLSHLIKQLNLSSVRIELKIFFWYHSQLIIYSLFWKDDLIIQNWKIILFYHVKKGKLFMRDSFLIGKFVLFLIACWEWLDSRIHVYFSLCVSFEINIF